MLPRPRERSRGVGVAVGTLNLGCLPARRLTRVTGEMDGKCHHQCGDDGENRQRPTGRDTHLLYSPARPRRCSVSGPLTSWAAVIGSVGPSPYDGQSLASTQIPHAGFRAWHTRLP